jgi:hypothetical protein
VGGDLVCEAEEGTGLGVGEVELEMQHAKFYR